MSTSTSRTKKIIAKLDELKKQVLQATPARPQRPAGPDRAKTYSVPVSADTAQFSKADAWVTIVEVSDFQCPFCKRVNPTLEQVKKEYGDDVRIALSSRSFHNRVAAAMGAELLQTTRASSGRCTISFLRTPRLFLTITSRAMQRQLVWT